MPERRSSHAWALTLALGATVLAALAGGCSDACSPRCQGLCGGEDGCGGTCPSTCPDGLACLPPTYDTCKPTGCATDADCPAGSRCDLADHQCRACAPSCTGRCGGEDGCGGTCASTCTAPETCQPPGYTTCAGGYLGTVYYVSNEGDDGADGTSEASAWASIGRVHGGSFQPGDAILFRRGDTWREELVISWSGEAGAHLTFGAYGAGPRPRILGSARATDWTEVAGHPAIWRSTSVPLAPSAGKASSIFFERADGTAAWGRVQATDETPVCGADFALLAQELDWCWQDGAVYVFAAADPDTLWASVEVPQRRAAISMESHAPQQHVTLDGLDLRYATMYGYDDGWPMAYEVRGLYILNCHIAYIGIQGGSAAMGLQIWHSEMIVRGNEIHDSGRRNVSYNVYLDNGRETGGVCDSPGLTFEGVLIEQNVLYHGFHTTGIDISSQPDVIATCDDTFRNFTIRDNLIWDDPADDPQAAPNDFTSMGIYLWGEGARFTGFEIYNNVLKHIKQKVLVLYNVKDTAVYNNTFWGMNERAGASTTYRAIVSAAAEVENLSFDNNLVYGNAVPFHLRLMQFSDDSAAGVVSLDHNLYFQEDASQGLVTIQDTTYDRAEWAAYQAATGWDANSPQPAHPALRAPEDFDFAPQPGSPAIDRGVQIPGRDTDFLGHPLLGAPDIGAVEAQE